MLSSSWIAVVVFLLKPTKIMTSESSFLRPVVFCGPSGGKCRNSQPLRPRPRAVHDSNGSNIDLNAVPLVAI